MSALWAFKFVSLQSTRSLFLVSKKDTKNKKHPIALAPVSDGVGVLVISSPFGRTDGAVSGPIDHNHIASRK